MVLFAGLASMLLIGVEVQRANADGVTVEIFLRSNFVKSGVD